VTVDVNHLHIEKIELVDFSYIVRGYWAMLVKCSLAPSDMSGANHLILQHMVDFDLQPANPVFSDQSHCNEQCLPQNMSTKITTLPVLVL
jgi:hypothetical protein